LSSKVYLVELGMFTGSGSLNNPANAEQFYQRPYCALC
jgi:hypothetical protein